MVDDLFNIEQMLNKNDTLMILVNESPHEPILAYLKFLWSTENIYTVVMPLANLQFNILNHSLVPKHEILNEQEKNNFMNLYNVKNNNQLPEISRFDPVAQVIGLRPNEVCKITRPSKTSITSLYYRVCLNE